MRLRLIVGVIAKIASIYRTAETPQRGVSTRQRADFMYRSVVCN